VRLLQALAMTLRPATLQSNSHHLNCGAQVECQRCAPWTPKIEDPNYRLFRLWPEGERRAAAHLQPAEGPRGSGGDWGINPFLLVMEAGVSSRFSLSFSGVETF